MEIGHYFVLTSLQVWQTAGVKNLKSYTLVMKERYTWARLKVTNILKAQIGI